MPGPSVAGVADARRRVTQGPRREVGGSEVVDPANQIGARAIVPIRRQVRVLSLVMRREENTSCSSPPEWGPLKRRLESVVISVPLRQSPGPRPGGLGDRVHLSGAPGADHDEVQRGALIHLPVSSVEPGVARIECSPSATSP